MGSRQKAKAAKMIDNAAAKELRENRGLRDELAIKKLGHQEEYQRHTPEKQLEEKFQQAVLKRAIMLIEANSELMDRAAIQQTCKLLGIEEPPAAAFAFPISKGSAVLQDEVTDSTLGV